MKNFKLILVAFIALSLFACNKKSRLTGDTNFNQNAGQQTSPKMSELLSNISGTWLVNVHPVTLNDDGFDIVDLDLTNFKEAFPFRIEFKDNSLVLTHVDENFTNYPPFQLVRIDNNQAYFHAEMDIKNNNDYIAKNFKKYFSIIDLTLDVSEDVPSYLLNFNIERINNNDLSSSMTASYIVSLTQKIDSIPYHSIVASDLAGKEFELKLSKPGTEIGQEIVTKMFMKVMEEKMQDKSVYVTTIRDFQSTEYNNTLFGKNIIQSPELVFSDMKPKFELDMSFIMEDSRYELLGYYFLENGKIVMRGKYRIQNIEIKEWDKNIGFDSDIGGDWNVDLFEPVREEGHFEAVEVI